MSGQQEEDKKPGDQSAAHINLKVKGQDGNEVFFRIKRSTQLKKLMNAYCDRQSVDFNSIAFLFDGRRLRGEQTPDELEMEDGDEIDAMLHQTGGTNASSVFSFGSFGEKRKNKKREQVRRRESQQRWTEAAEERVEALVRRSVRFKGRKRRRKGKAKEKEKEREKKKKTPAAEGTGDGGGRSESEERGGERLLDLSEVLVKKTAPSQWREENKN
ncbi:hypothetical protein CRYUN_Cryun01aG0122700 [Craigia yunnanensis]